MSNSAIASKPRTLQISAEVPAIFDAWDEPYRYKIAEGGRGAMKSWTVAQKAILRAIAAPERILCGRELQKSIGDSVHRLLSDQIIRMGLAEIFDVQRQKIRCLLSGSTFLFEGLAHNVQKIMSLEGITICWVEQGERVSEESWKVLIPTIRTPGSEIWVTYNPDKETDPTYKRFHINPPPNCLIIRVNSTDNPWLSAELRAERDYLYRVDADAAAHIWGGSTRVSTDAQILHGKCKVEAFEPGADWDGPYLGGDWGFSRDPTTLIKLWVHDGRLYVEYESWAIGLEIVDTANRWRHDVPGCEETMIRADNARPETISHVARDGLKIESVDKWKGSVEDGIAFLRSFEDIVIHPRCKHFEQETRLYSYKEDRLTGDILTTIIDKHNHCIDAARYALAPIIKQDQYAVGGFL